MAQMGFGGVKTFAGGGVLGVRAQHGQQGVAGVAGGLQIAAFVHVPVVVNPLRGNAGAAQAQRRAPLLRRGRLFASFAFALVQKPPDACVRDLQGLHHGGQAFVAHALQFGDAFTLRLRVGLAREFFDEVVGQLRHIGQLGPRQLQRGAELVQKVPHAALAAGQPEGQEGSHKSPAQPAAKAHGVVYFLHRCDVVARQPERLAPERLHQAVGDKSVYFLAHNQRAHPALAVE